MKIKLEKKEVATWLKLILPENLIKGYDFIGVDSVYNGLEIEFMPKTEEEEEEETND